MRLARKKTISPIRMVVNPTAPKFIKLFAPVGGKGVGELLATGDGVSCEEGVTRSVGVGVGDIVSV